MASILENAARSASKKLYRAEIHRQGVGWDEYCTKLLIEAQHELVSAINSEDKEQ